MTRKHRILLERLASHRTGPQDWNLRVKLTISVSQAAHHKHLYLWDLSYLSLSITLGDKNYYLSFAIADTTSED